jgi:hypothetical protein
LLKQRQILQQQQYMMALQQQQHMMLPPMQQQMAMQHLMLQQPSHMQHQSFYNQNMISPQTVAPKKEQSSNMFFGNKNQTSTNTSIVGSRILNGDESSLNIKKQQMIRSASGHSISSNHAPVESHDPYYQRTKNPSPIRSQIP